MMKRSERKRGSRVWLLVRFSFVSLVPGCGAAVDTGNTGSETHWLQSCDEDADCGEYSCYCGVCSRGCTDDSQCDEANNVTSHCAAATSGASCSSETPDRVCVAGSAVDSPEDEDAATGDAGQSTPTPPLTICDGSDAIRFVYRDVGGGGPVSGWVQFVSQIGNRFVAIDGKCSFWASTGDGHVVEGQILDQTILRAYEASYYGQMGRFAEVRDIPYGVFCLDRNFIFVGDPSGAFRAIAYCDEFPAPEGWQELLQTAGELVDATVPLGERTSGALRLLLQPASEDATTFVTWPLDLDPATMIQDMLSLGDYYDRDTGIRFEAGSRASLLREAFGVEPVMQFEYATSGARFEAVLRDELPTKVFAAFDAAAGDAAVAEEGGAGVVCDEQNVCIIGLSCHERAGALGGGTACNTCIKPNDPDWVCHTNDDCCGGLTCCVDCGEKSGTCIAEPDPCATCIANGGVWLTNGTCAPGCGPDQQCYSDSCPGACEENNCGGCGRAQECWAAGCTPVVENETAYCDVPTIEVPPTDPCEVTATDPSVPGVSVHLEADECTFQQGRGGQFRYRVELNQSLDFTTQSSGGGCGLCGDATDPETWIKFEIGGNEKLYCPECDVGCCAPTEATATSVDAQTIEGTIDWPGLEWNGPSDTNNEPSGEFPPGSYTTSVHFTVPGVGEVVAELPIAVRGLITN